MTPRSFLQSLTPQQTHTLYNEAGFLLLKDVPAQTLVSLDGTTNQVLGTSTFSGYKLLPPTLHLLTLTSSQTMQSGIPIPLNGTLFFSPPRQTLQRSFDVAHDSLRSYDSDNDAGQIIVSKDVLKGLDPTLAPYDYEGYERWNALFPKDCVTPRLIANVLGPPSSSSSSASSTAGMFWDLDGFDIAGLDGEMTLRGEEADDEETSLGVERVLRHRAEREKAKSATQGEETTREVHRKEVLPQSGLTELCSDSTISQEGVDGQQMDESTPIPPASSSASASTSAQSGPLQVSATFSSPLPSSSPSAIEKRRYPLWVTCDLRKSWRQGAVGEERTRFAADKSWLFWHVVQEQCDGDPTLLLTQLSLLFPLTTHLRAPTLFLKPYRRIYTLFTHAHLHLMPSSASSSSFSSTTASSVLAPLDIIDDAISEKSSSPFPPRTRLEILGLYARFLRLIAIQLSAAGVASSEEMTMGGGGGGGEGGFFESELPEAKGWVVEGLQTLRKGLMKALKGSCPRSSGWEDVPGTVSSGGGVGDDGEGGEWEMRKKEVREAWEEVRKVVMVGKGDEARERYGWEGIGSLCESLGSAVERGKNQGRFGGRKGDEEEEEEEEEEDEEDRPVVVEL